MTCPQKMTAGKRYQREVTTGNLSFLVAILSCIVLWSVRFDSIGYAGSLSIYVLVGYILTELNTRFSLIRTRTALPVSLYWIIVAICSFLHPFKAINLVPLAFILAIHQLFSSYENEKSIGNTFNSFFFLSAGSMVFPPLLYFVLPFLFGMKRFRSLTVKTFFAALSGTALPYWFLFGYAFLSDKPELFAGSLRSLCTVLPPDYGGISVNHVVAFAIVTFFSLTGSIHYLLVSYQDKTQIRIYYSFLLLIEVCIYALGYFQPQHFQQLLSMQLIIVSLLMSHWLVLSKTRFSAIALTVTLILLVLWAIFDVWMR